MYGPSPSDDRANYMINLWENGSTIIYDATAIEVALVESFGNTEHLPPECKNEAPIDCDRAHQATLDLCRGGK